MAKGGRTVNLGADARWPRVDGLRRRGANALGRARPSLRIAAGLLFAAQFALLDAVVRGPRVDGDRAAALIASGLVWAALLSAATTTRRRRVILALLAALVFVLQSFAHRFFHVPIDLQVVEGARHSWRDVRGALGRLLPWAALAVFAASALELVLLEAAPRVRGRRWTFGLGAAAVLALLVAGDPRRGTPDVCGVHALVALGREPPSRVIAGAVALPPLHSDRREVPDVLVILTESVRADDYVPRGEAPTAPHALAASRGRVDLAQMRAVSTYTAVSLSALLTGRSQEVAREEILRAGNLFDFAHAAGAHVAYYSAQSHETFETKDVRAAVDRFFTLETLVGHEIDDDSKLVELPLDAMVVDRFIAELPQVRRPSLTVLHLYSTHAPYWFADERAPFTPFERSVAWAAMPKLHNAYRNAILEQDGHVARAVRAFIEHAGSRPWLVAFTSDHGEAFGEHSAIHHGQNLYDEQLHVPGWIAMGPNTLAPAEASALAAQREQFVTHLDLLPTVLDVMGLWDNFSVRPHRDRMRGRSLLRPIPSPVSAADPIPLTNCTALFRCPLNAWGLLAGDRKLVAQPWDADWRCMALGAEEQLAPADDPACQALRAASRARFPLLPNNTPNR